jgi:hypothetical protein
MTNWILSFWLLSFLLSLSMCLCEHYLGTEKSVEKRSGYRYNKDGTIVVTHDLTGEAHPRILQKREPFSVVDTLSQAGRQRDRTYYDKDGLMIKQISNGPHGNLKTHPFGEHGEHTHDIIWKDGKIVDRPTRDMTEKEKRRTATFYESERFV